VVKCANGEAIIVVLSNSLVTLLRSDITFSPCAKCLNPPAITATAWHQAPL